MSCWHIIASIRQILHDARMMALEDSDLEPPWAMLTTD